MSVQNRGVRKKTVLLVEDDPDQLATRALLLEHSGFSCVKAGDATSAARIAARESPDCVVMDLCVPTEDDGLGLIHAASALPNHPPIILLTGRRKAVLSGRPELEHIAAVIEKGRPSADLMAAVKRACLSR